jgi:alkylhydroperoxidase family enzyme
MARLPFVVPEDHPELAPLIEKIKGQRRGSLLNLYRVFLNSPALADAWLDFISTVRFSSKITEYLREIIIIQVGFLNRSQYVLRQHIPKLGVAAGLTLEQCNALENWRASSSLFDDVSLAALDYSEAVTANIDIPDAVFAALRRHFDDQEVMELSLLIGAYNMHTRVLRALDVDLEPAPSPAG